jgi:signal transduction histidine kinase
MLERVHGVPIALWVGDGVDGDTDRCLAVLRIAHEALHNALRHARPEHVTVSLAHVDGTLTVEVHDDGVGFEPASTELRSRHLGLTSMEERAGELGGRLQIRSAPGTGTTVRLEVPAE